MINNKTKIVVIGILAMMFLLFFMFQSSPNPVVIEEQEGSKEELLKKLEDTENRLKELEDKSSTESKKIIEQPVVSQKERTVGEIAKEWAPQVVYLECAWAYDSGVLYKEAAGSGFLVNYSDGIIGITTNKHIILDQGLYLPEGCLIYFPNGELYLADKASKPFFGSGKYDLANIHLKGLSNDLTATATRLAEGAYCLGVAEIGDKIVILGYPGIGSNEGITVTEGIISGYEGVYYVTSAKIDHGNSGGIAVSLKDNCVVGIPSSSVGGKLESLGRILSSRAILEQ